ncbi:MAG TPA: VOC family protein [Myxococcota bacterium]|nr:VOC family protein [Myxococcota bacterium]
MPRLDHLTIFVRDWRAARAWYVETLGFRPEFEIPERGTAALQDDAGLTLFLHERADEVAASGCVMTFQVDDVERVFEALSARGVRFEHGPAKVFWGYGAELLDPDGHRIWLWDERTMREKGDG